MPLPRTLVALALLLGSSVVAAPAQQIAFTFDDLPAHGSKPTSTTRLEIADSILATLKRENLPPTYGFINAKRVNEDASTLAVLQAWRAAGQPLGNHTWAHENLDEETIDQFKQDVLKDEPLLKQLMPADDWHWFRYPFLHEGDTLQKHREARSFLLERGYRIAEVNMDFEDYLWNAPYARCVDKHDDGSIQKLHDTYLATAAQYYDVFRRLSQLVYGRDVKYVLLMHIGAFDAKMLPELIALYRTKGVSFISLAEAEQDPIYEQRRRPWLEGRGSATGVHDGVEGTKIPAQQQALQAVGRDVPLSLCGKVPDGF